MSTAAFPRDINFVKVGAVAAFLLAVTLVAAMASFFTLSDAATRGEAEEFLEDVVDKRIQYIAVVWLWAFSALLRVPFALGLYYGLRRWGEDYMRVAVLFAVVAAFLFALSWAPVAARAAYIVPAWGEAGDEATRAMLLSDFTTLAWVSNAMFTMFHVAIGIAFIAFSLVMLRLGQLLWTVLGWIGIVAAVLFIVGAFFLAAEGFVIAAIIATILEIIWLLGAGVGLWRLPAEGEPA